LGRLRANVSLSCVREAESEEQFARFQTNERRKPRKHKKQRWCQSTACPQVRAGKFVVHYKSAKTAARSSRTLPPSVVILDPCSTRPKKTQCPWLPEQRPCWIAVFALPTLLVRPMMRGRNVLLNRGSCSQYLRHCAQSHFKNPDAIPRAATRAIMISTFKYSAYCRPSKAKTPNSTAPTMLYAGSGLLF